MRARSPSLFSSGGPSLKHGARSSGLPPRRDTCAGNWQCAQKSLDSMPMRPSCQYANHAETSSWLPCTSSLLPCSDELRSIGDKPECREAPSDWDADAFGQANLERAMIADEHLLEAVHLPHITCSRVFQVPVSDSDSARQRLNSHLNPIYRVGPICGTVDAGICTRLPLSTSKEALWDLRHQDTLAQAPPVQPAQCRCDHR